MMSAKLDIVQLLQARPDWPNLPRMMDVIRTESLETCSLLQVAGHLSRLCAITLENRCAVVVVRSTEDRGREASGIRRCRRSGPSSEGCGDRSSDG